ncbi:hypothetical protein JKP88DRAFT_252505 [Tribonema minus]|uniref:Uncharacterized protein n=1 Tax=Tribonema minus TaxID=303371 RepID=A0A835ZBH6_9STRA|nr:hypothetical protein JKP88DRAFT_252505 [Tribonema minus]
MQESIVEGVACQGASMRSIVAAPAASGDPAAKESFALCAHWQLARLKRVICCMEDPATHIVKPLHQSICGIIQEDRVEAARKVQLLKEEGSAEARWNKLERLRDEGDKILRQQRAAKRERAALRAEGLHMPVAARRRPRWQRQVDQKKKKLPMHPSHRSVTLVTWLVDRTFTTKGHQLKLLLVTSYDSHQGPHGLTELPRRGYQERLHALDHVVPVVTGVDPGQVLAFSAVTALGQRWSRENAADFAANPPPQGEGVTAQEVSGADYRIWAKSVRNEQGEAQRRGANHWQAYSDALAALADRYIRTGRYQALRAYCTTWGHHANAMWGELLHPARRHQRFSRFRAQQAGIAKMSEKLPVAPIWLQHRPPGWKRVRSRGHRYPRRKRRHRRWRDTHRRPRRIIFFGACGGGGGLLSSTATPMRMPTSACAASTYATCGVADIIPGYVPADQEEEEDIEDEESDEEDDDEEDGDEEDDEEDDEVEGGDGDEGDNGGGDPVDNGEGGGDEKGVDEEGDAIMA